MTNQQNLKKIWQTIIIGFSLFTSAAHIPPRSLPWAIRQDEVGGKCYREGRVEGGVGREWTGDQSKKHRKTQNQQKLAVVRGIEK